MPYALSIATPATRKLVVDALRGRADVLKRTATRASADVEQDRGAGKDVRSRAVKLVTMLAEASDLEALATELEAAQELALVEAGPGLRLVPIPDPTPRALTLDEVDAALAAADAEEDDDGLSPEAHALAEAAGLTATVLEDAETGALPEDEPAAADLAEAALILEPTGEPTP